MSFLMPFDPTALLPKGTTLLEASAGTGKTQAIAGLAVRYLAEGLTDAAHLTIITFSRTATAELSERVQVQLANTLSSPDTALDATSIARLQQAETDADLIQIMTIHEFCSAMTRELGVLANTDPNTTLTDDLSVLRDDTARDEYLRLFGSANPPPFALNEALKLSAAAIATPDAKIVPADTDSPATSARVAFAHSIRDAFAERKRRIGVHTFDDQLTRLRDAVVGDDNQKAAARARIQNRCQVVLVDEFQDTDPVQWQILRTCFDKVRPLVLIGDPKQAIYRFRGAEIRSYLSAVDSATQRWGLTTNYRSDPGVTSALNHLFDGLQLGPRIGVPPVVAKRTSSRLIVPNGSPWQAPVRIRCIAEDTPLTAAKARAAIATDLLSELGTLLAGDVLLITESETRRIRGDDIAVLVRSNAHGTELAKQLTQAGIAASFAGADSVFNSTAARSWLTLLQALQQPRGSIVREVVLTDFFGKSIVELATATGAEASDWSATLIRWAEVLSASGIAALFTLILAEYGFGERLMTRPLGERDLTDYRHVVELLHSQQANGVTGKVLIEWLATQLTSPLTEGERARRLETDEHAVQIMTVHRAKGLQFPVVLLPQVNDLWQPKDSGDPLHFHDEHGQRMLDVGGQHAAGRVKRLQAARDEDAEDSLRTLYVAATRAQSQLTMWWSRTKANTAAAALHRVLFRSRELPSAPLSCYPVDIPPGNGNPADLPWLKDSGISVETGGSDSVAFVVPQPSEPPKLTLPQWTRRIDQAWCRTSYSGLIAGTHAHPPLALTIHESASSGADEPDANIPDEVSEDLNSSAGPLAIPSPMAALPSGTAFGTLVHHVLETLDCYAPNPGDEPALQDRLHEICAAALRQAPLDGVTPDTLAVAISPALHTSLGELSGGKRLVDIQISDRLSELNFEATVGSATSHLTLAGVAELLREFLPATDVLAAYPDLLLAPALRDQPLRGFITGSIDTVLRVGTPDQPRFLVVDYKTNRISIAPELTLGHFTKAAMTAEMMRSHYPLQALIYGVMLHRFLSARMRGYQPELHLGGIGYLFVRGMGGPDTPWDGDAPLGVFNWQPSAALIVTLSEQINARSIP